MVETAVLGCHFQTICFDLKVGLEGGWDRLEFKVSIVVFFLGFIQLQDFEVGFVFFTFDIAAGISCVRQIYNNR